MNMNDKQIIDMLLNRQVEIIHKFNTAIMNILRLGINTERGKEIIPDLINSINYTLEEIERITNR